MVSQLQISILVYSLFIYYYSVSAKNISVTNGKENPLRCKQENSTDNNLRGNHTCVKNETVLSANDKRDVKVLKTPSACNNSEATADRNFIVAPKTPTTPCTTGEKADDEGNCRPIV